MTAPTTARSSDTGLEAPVDTRIVLSTLWTTMLFVFAYVDIFGFWRADVIRGALAGVVPGAGFAVDQRFLALTTAYILVPSLMVAGSLLLPRRVARPASIALAALYALTILGSAAGEPWIYYLLGSGVEVVLLGCIALRAWRWR